MLPRHRARLNPSKKVSEFMPVVVVESPAKAKTINKYLGSDYTVLASYGHVRDLPAKNGSVEPDDDFAMTWEVGNDSKKHVRAIAEALKNDNALILATDPDREGEAISWHLQEALTKRRSIKKDTPVSRVTFNAITKDAVGARRQPHGRNQAQGRPKQQCPEQRIRSIKLGLDHRHMGRKTTPEIANDHKGCGRAARDFEGVHN